MHGDLARAAARPGCGRRCRRRSAGSTPPRRRPRRRGTPPASGPRSGRRRSRRGRRRPEPTVETGSSGSVWTSSRRRSAPSPTAATQPSGRVIAASLGAQPDQLQQALGEVAAVGELLADQLLGLALVRGHHRGAGPDPGQHRLALGVEHDRDAAAARGRRSAARRGRRRPPAAASRRGRRAWRRRPGSRSARRAASTSSGLTAGPRSLISVCSPEVGSITARLIRVSAAIRVKSVSTDSSCSCSSTRRPGRAADEAGGDHRAAEQAERAGDVDALAAGDGAALDRAVAVAEAEVGHRDGAVDRRVQGHGEDHLALTRLRSSLRSCGPPGAAALPRS